MGVYRATDTKLGTEVAAKVRPEALTQNADRLANFEHEAQLLPADLKTHSPAALDGIHHATTRTTGG